MSLPSDRDTLVAITVIKSDDNNNSPRDIYAKTSETEGMLMSAQDQSPRTSYIRKTEEAENISGKCRKCGDRDETTTYRMRM